MNKNNLITLNNKLKIKKNPSNKTFEDKPNKPTDLDNKKDNEILFLKKEINELKKDIVEIKKQVNDIVEIKKQVNDIVEIISTILVLNK